MPEQHEKTGTEPNCISGHQLAWTSERAGYSAMSSSVCQNSVVLGNWFKDFNSSSKGASPSLAEISQKLFQVTSNDASRVPPWPGLSAYQTEEPSSKLSCNTAVCSYQTEEVAPKFSNAVVEKKEPSMLRLFGVNLIDHTKSSATADKMTVGVGEISTRAAGSLEDSSQLSALSKVTKDHTQFVNESPREIQSHQSCTGRTRIKVQVLFFSLFLILELHCILS